MEKLMTAFHFGADAVYIGLKDFSLRAKAKNISTEELKKAVEYADNKNKKVYVALNVYFTPDQIDDLIKYLKIINKIKPHGIIISDLGALHLSKIHAPDIPVHISTQANITNQAAALFLKNLGISRIILARELTLKEIKKIADSTDIKLEAFVHGAMCIAYSGRCLLSAYLTHPALGEKQDEKNSRIRSANKGICTHSCRWEYILKEKTRQDQDYEIIQDENSTFVMSSKDMCMIDYIDELVKAGIRAFKIEGRMKSLLYVSSITRAYRQAIDHWAHPKIPYDKKIICNELDIVSHREFSTGFYFESPKKNANTTKKLIYTRRMRLAALVNEVKDIKVYLKVFNTISENSILECMGAEMKTIKLGRIEFYKKNKKAMTSNQTDCIEAKIFDINGSIIIPEQFDIIRMEAEF